MSSAEVDSAAEGAGSGALGGGAGMALGGGLGLLGSIMQGQENAKISNINAQNQMYQASGSSPRKEVLPFLDENLKALVEAYKNRSYIPTTAGSTTGLNKAIDLGLNTDVFQRLKELSGSGLDTMKTGVGGLEKIATTGSYAVNPQQITEYANSLINPSLINSQVDAYSRDIARNLGENQITGIREADIATGNLGSSRGGIQEAIARRGAEDRIANFRGQLYGDLYGNALTKAQNQLNQNAQGEAEAYGRLLGAGTQIQGSGDQLLKLNQNQLDQLASTGKLQQILEQGNINNQIGARDFGVSDLTKLNQLLMANASVGNYIDPNRVAKVDEGGGGFITNLVKGLF